ncbi:hypothetical protein DPMN_186781 [Dreissena polymorpha]|uniref:Uncharacterized protein n=1 Tax=Dreissena polymorpha TaxID=45954 RepID=A0A9D4I8G6_DREPO|nr:hypothetical protein DPMN_186781 [Dreissena polymorpha]
MFQYNFSRTDYSQLEAELLRLPSELQGSAINSHCGTERLWSQQSLVTTYETYSWKTIKLC